MNKILVEVSVGELLDKISILEIKKEKIKNPEKLRFINDEYDVLKDQFNKNVKSDEKLDSLFKSLKEINSKLWVIEDNKRLCEKNSDTYRHQTISTGLWKRNYPDDERNFSSEHSHHNGPYRCRKIYNFNNF